MSSFSVPKNVGVSASHSLKDEFISTRAMIKVQLYTLLRCLFNVLNLYIIINTETLITSMLNRRISVHKVSQLLLKYDIIILCDALLWDKQALEFSWIPFSQKLWSNK